MPSELERGVAGSRQFSITASPFLRLLRRIHLTRGDGTPRAWALVGIAWLPLFGAAVARAITGHGPPPFLLDLAVHARLLIELPLLIAAERVLEVHCRLAIAQLYDGNFAETAVVDRIADRAERLRESRAVELGLVVLVVVFSQLMLWGVLGGSGVFSGVTRLASVTFARVWYATVAWPIVTFVMLRWLWHWMIWSYILMRLSRLPLAMIATHPDHAAGIGFLSLPVAGFSGFVGATSSVLAAAWATKILNGAATLQTFVPPFYGVLVLAVLLGYGPLLLFIVPLFRARRRDMVRYNGVALDYMRAFDRKWVQAHPENEVLLGSSDVQSLADMANAFENLVKVRLVPFGLREVIRVCLAVVLPMLPLVLTAVPLDQLLQRIGEALLGRLPG